MQRFRSFILFAFVAALAGFALPSCQESSSSGDQAASSGEPPIFDHRPYAEAKQAAADGKKWFIVKGTAVWCGPCKQMDKTTWRDPKVVAWLTDRAIVTALDVDQQASIAAALKIQAMPTMIAFKGEEEFDRIVGYRSAADLLTWLEGLERGEKSIELVKKKAGSRDSKDGPVDVQARLELARTLASSGDTVKATEEYIWLWQNMLEQNRAFVGVRLSFMVNEMQQLALRDADAKRSFTQLRDETRTRVAAEKVDTQDVSDLIALNKVIGDRAAIMSWFDDVKGKPAWKPVLARVSFYLEEQLIEESRWADLGSILSEPIRRLEMDKEVPVPPGVDEQTKKMMMEFATKRLRDEAGVFYAALLAAGQEEVAANLAKRAVELDDSPAMVRSMVERALVAGEPREAQGAMTKAAEAKDPDMAKLRAEVEQALASGKAKGDAKAGAK